MEKVFKVFAGDEAPAEEIIDPELPIIDAHHHLWPTESPIATYPIEDFLRLDVGTGHNVVATVFAECMACYHEGGVEALRPVGETEFVVASCPILPGRPAVAAKIVGHADLSRPGLAARTLDGHIEAGQGRFAGIRYNVYWHEEPEKMVTGPRRYPRHHLLDPAVQAGLGEVSKRGLTYDCYMFSDQLPDLAATADALPDLTIILDHMGGPVTVDHSPAARKAVFDRWRAQLADVAQRPNVVLKVGGMGMHHYGFPYDELGHRPQAREVADMWRDYVDVAIAAFGPARCMTESNFPVDKSGIGYSAYWNAMKLLTRGYSAEERADMFSGTASRVYGVSLG